MPKIYQNAFFTRRWQEQAELLFTRVKDMREADLVTMDKELLDIFKETGALLESLVDQQMGVVLKVHEAPFVETRIFEHPVTEKHVNTNYHGLSNIDGFNQLEKEGWELVSVAETQRPVRWSRIEEGQDCGSKEILTVPVYVLGRRRDVAMQELRESVREAKRIAQEADRKVYDAEKSLEESEAAVVKYRKQWKEAAQSLDVAYEESKKREERIHALQVQLEAKNATIAALNAKIVKLA